MLHVYVFIRNLIFITAEMLNFLSDFAIKNLDYLSWTKRNFLEVDELEMYFLLLKFR
jgi:hypothetical protein